MENKCFMTMDSVTEQRVNKVGENMITRSGQ